MPAEQPGLRAAFRRSRTTGMLLLVEYEEMRAPAGD